LATVLELVVAGHPLLIAAQILLQNALTAAFNPVNECGRRGILILAIGGSRLRSVGAAIVRDLAKAWVVLFTAFILLVLVSGSIPEEVP
jgi:hypothetical protein